MIIDKLSNIDKYPQISDEVKAFIKNLPTQSGKYKINDTDYANIEEYDTKFHENCFFEAHKNFADIQLLLFGKERLDYTGFEDLTIKTPYNPEKDIMFYENTKAEQVSVYLDGSNFVMLFPNEAHKPQMNIDDTSHHVKKVVVKIKS